MKPFFCIFSVLCMICLCTCVIDADLEDSSVVIATWNVQNLFDGVDDGSEYEEYTSSGGWNDSQYRIRLSKIATVFSYSGLKDADIIVLNEVENGNVVEDILKTNTMTKLGFSYYALSGETAIISRIPIDKATVHSSDGQRPVIETNFSCNGITINLLAIHAKSNIGDESENISARM